MSGRLLPLLLALVALPALRSSSQAAPPAAEGTVAIEHARLFLGEGAVIEDGTVVFERGAAARRGRVLQAGPASAVTVPAGAERIDGRGGFVTPGLFDAESRAGLIEIALEESTYEAGLPGYGPVRAAFSVGDGWNPESVVVPVTRLEGVTTVALAPEGGLVAGRGAIADLGIARGADGSDLILRAPSALYLDLGLAGRYQAGGARGGELLRVRELVDDVRQYQQRRADFEKNQMRHVAASRLDLEALIPAFAARGGRPELPVVVAVHKAVDLVAALRLVRELGLRAIFSGCEEGWRVAGDLAAAGVPCIVHPFEDLPGSFEVLGSRLDNAALLARAGVTIALSPRLVEPHNARVLRIEAGNAVANGLPFAEALRAITLTPARLFGVDDQVGALAPGRLADVVLWSGDPLETSTRVKALWVRGRAVPLVSRQTLLRDRYLDLSHARPQVRTSDSAATPPR